MTTPPPGYPPPAPPQKSHTNTIIIGSAVALILAIVGTGVFVAQARDDNSSAPAPSATPVSTPAEASPSASLSPECRTWIKSELLDSTETIEAAPGVEACGYLSDAELAAAIDEVTAELSAEITPSVE